jgi:ribosome-associated toxin RatA of RatAB toxin-antitoxin module
MVMLTGIRHTTATTGGRAGARQFVVTLVVLSLSLVTLRGAGSQAGPVSVREEQGLYRVAASFATAHPMRLAHAVLTDYEQIPRFLTDVRTSRIIERGDGRVVVEQEAVARLLVFSKRVNLVLEVQEQPASIRFRDRSGRSFTQYEGAWTLREQDGGTLVSYELTARPAFEVPAFLLTRVFRRDADRMIEHLQAEIAARASAVAARR